MCGIRCPWRSETSFRCWSRDCGGSEYRGYDSCGVAVHADRRVEAGAQRSGSSELDAQRRACPASPASLHALGHARRADTLKRAPALLGRPGTTTRARVNRGWCTTASIENYEELRRKLIAAATSSDSQTDTGGHRPTWSTSCTRATCSTPCSARRELHGAYAIAVVLPRRSRTGGRCAQGIAAGGRLSSRWLSLTAP